MKAIEQTFQLKRRPGLRLVCGIIALLAFGYLAEIFFMGAPEWRRGSDRTYTREKDPIPFWCQFAVFAAVDVSAAYSCLDWRKALSLIHTVEQRDQKMLEAMGPKEAQRVENMRLLRIAVLVIPLIFALGLLLALLIST